MSPYSHNELHRMLGAILTTALTFLIATRLPNYRRRLYDPEVSNGKLLVGVPDPDRSCRAALEDALYQVGAEQVRVFPPVRDPSRK